MMDLNPKQIKQLDDALKSAFPDLDDLERMVLYQFGKNLAEIAEGNNLATVTFRLIKWARATGCVAELITKAHTENPGNELLKRCLREFQQASVPQQQPRIADTTRHTSAQVWDVWQFDMDRLIEHCLGELLLRHGLVGIVLPCDDDTFHTSFCERLRHVLGRDNTRVRVPLAVTPTTPPDQRVHDIQRIKPFPYEQNIICPVPLRYYNDAQGASQIIANFWQSLHAVCHVQKDQRLIIVMFPSEACTYPFDMITPGQPRFGEEHVLLWTRKITDSLGWPEEARQQWHTRMINECLTCETLSIGRVYQHLRDTLELLHDRQTDYQQFLAAIDQRI